MSSDHQDVIAYVQDQMREYVFWINKFNCKYIADKYYIECIISYLPKYRSWSSWPTEFQEIQNLVKRTSQVLNILYWMIEQSFEGKSLQTMQAYKTTVYLYKAPGLDNGNHHGSSGIIIG